MAFIEYNVWIVKFLAKEADLLEVKSTHEGWPISFSVVRKIENKKVSLQIGATLR